MKKKNIFWGIVLGGLLLMNNMAGAYSVRTPDGKMPVVHWVVMEALPGKLPELQGLSDKYIAPHAEKNPGVYALYGGADKNNPDLIRLLEIYRDEATIELHRTQPMFPVYLEERKPVLIKSQMFDADPVALESKAYGTGAYSILNLFEVKPEQLAEFKTVISGEMIRAVDNDRDVLGLFATAEKTRGNYIHTMEIFADEKAYEQYTDSTAYKKYQALIKDMVITQKTFENMPVKIVLTGKGLQK